MPPRRFFFTTTPAEGAEIDAGLARLGCDSTAELCRSAVLALVRGTDPIGESVARCLPSEVMEREIARRQHGGAR